MGCAYSQTNLGRDCTYFSAGPIGTDARWGDSLEVSMGNWKEDDDCIEVWGVDNKTAGHEKYSCGFQLKARASHDKDGVESIHFGLTDGDYSTDNNTSFSLDITRVGCDDLVGYHNSTGTKIGVSSNSLDQPNQQQGEDEEAIRQVVKQAIFSSNINKGPINSNGHTTGSLNRSIMIFNF